MLAKPIAVVNLPAPSPPSHMKSKRRSKPLISSLITFEQQESEAALHYYETDEQDAPLRVCLPAGTGTSLDPNDSGIAFHHSQALETRAPGASCCQTAAFALMSRCLHSICRDCLRDALIAVHQPEKGVAKVMLCWCGSESGGIDALSLQPSYRKQQLLDALKPSNNFASTVLAQPLPLGQNKLTIHLPSCESESQSPDSANKTIGKPDTVCTPLPMTDDIPLIKVSLA